MKVTIQQKALADLASKAASVADQKGVMPILGMAILHAEKGRLHIAATDLYTSAKASATCAVEVPGKAFAVPAKALKDVVGKMPDGEVKLVLDKGKLRLTSGRSRYHLPSSNADDAPPIPAMPEHSVEVEAGDIARALDAAAVAASTDGSRPHLCCVRLEVDARRVRAVASDGHRLQQRDITRKGPEMAPVSIPAKGVGLLKALGKGPAQLAADGGNLFASMDETTVVVKLVDDSFPPYEKIIPANAKQTVRVDRKELLAAVGRVLTVSKRETKGVTISTSADLVVIEAEGDDGAGGREEVPASCAEGGSIGLNAAYLSEALAKCEADDVDLWLSGELDPFQVRADGYIGLVMPMRP